MDVILGVIVLSTFRESFPIKMYTTMVKGDFVHLHVLHLTLKYDDMLLKCVCVVDCIMLLEYGSTFTF
jgi:hypothetical protein